MEKSQIFQEIHKNQSQFSPQLHNLDGSMSELVLTGEACSRNTIVWCVCGVIVKCQRNLYNQKIFACYRDRVTILNTILHFSFPENMSSYTLFVQ